MGHAESEVYLSSPAVAAASSIRGSICHPEEIVKKGMRVEDRSASSRTRG
jgi:hypothetical protein